MTAAHDADDGRASLEERVRELTAALAQRDAELAAGRDARLRLEAELRRSEARYRPLFETGILGIMTADVHGGVVEANAAFLDLVGYTRAELTQGRVRWDALSPPEWTEHDRRGLDRLRTTGVVPAWEKEFFHKQGHRIPVLVGAAMIDGVPDQCLCFVLDLTDRKHAEAAAARMREQHTADLRFRALLDTAPDAMVVAGADGRITFANVQSEALFGYSRAEMLGTHIEQLIPERMRARHAQHLQAFFTNPSARPMGSGVELFGLRKDGTELPIEVSLSPLQSDQSLTVSAAIRDISERKRLEAATKLVSERLSSAVESIQEAFALFDDHDRLVLYNSVYRRLIGDALPGSLLGMRYEHILDAWIEQIEFVTDAERRHFRSERLGRRHQAPTASFDLRLRDGRSLRVIDRRTAEGGTVKTIWDLTEDTRRAEELHEARAAAEAASRAKSEFLSSMSHELRTPLNAILGFAQLLRRDKREPLSDRHKERVHQILTGGEHLLRLIDDILDLSRVESGSVAISIEPLSVAEVLEHVKTTLEPLAAKVDVSIAIEPPAPDLPLIVGDRTRFAQILMNFGSNAIKYNRPAGKVAFRAIMLDGGPIRVVVTDTGIGIPADRQSKLFQAFQRAGQETGPIEGTGIGLFITKRLAELMRGEVGFRSTAGQGSEFWVDMPADQSSASQQVAGSLRVQDHDGALHGHAHRQILYVEDNPANVAFMRDLFDAFDNFELLTAPSGERGVELARECKPALVVMDINLPGMSGLDALRALRESRETLHIPVIALSAAALERDRLRGLQAGFDAYLTKPVDVEAFISVVEQLLQAHPRD